MYCLQETHKDRWYWYILQQLPCLEKYFYITRSVFNDEPTL